MQSDMLRQWARRELGGFERARLAALPAHGRVAVAAAALAAAIGIVQSAGPRRRREHRLIDAAACVGAHVTIGTAADVDQRF